MTNSRPLAKSVSQPTRSHMHCRTSEANNVLSVSMTARKVTALFKTY